MTSPPLLWQGSLHAPLTTNHGIKRVRAYPYPPKSFRVTPFSGHVEPGETATVLLFS